MNASANTWFLTSTESFTGISISLFIINSFLFLKIRIPNMYLSTQNFYLALNSLTLKESAGMKSFIPSILPIVFLFCTLLFFFPIVWAWVFLFLFKVSLFTCTICCFFLKLALSCDLTQYLISIFNLLSPHSQHINVFKSLLILKKSHSIDVVFKLLKSSIFWIFTSISFLCEIKPPTLHFTFNLPS